MIISIDPVQHTIDLDTETYYPIHGFVKIRCRERVEEAEGAAEGCDYTFIAQVQRTHILEEYVQLRKQSVKVVPSKYLEQLLETGLRYVVVALPILIIDNNESDTTRRAQTKNIFIQIERFIQSGLVKPHAMEVDPDQSDLPDLLTYIFPAEDGLFIGNLLYGDTAVYLPAKYLPYHLALFGITGSGKSNLMQVTLHSVLNYNAQQLFYCTTARRPLVGMLAIDPHDEYAFGTEENGAGLQHIIQSLDPLVAQQLMGDFYYLHPAGTRVRNELLPYAQTLLLAYEDLIPSDLLNAQEFNAQQAELMFGTHNLNHENWIQALMDHTNLPVDAHDATVPAVTRRLRPLERSRIFRQGIASHLLGIVDALETGKVLDANTSLASDFEQFLFTTVIARVIFDIRKSLKSATTLDEFQSQLELRLPAPIYNQFIESDNRLARYIAQGDQVKDPKEMPVIVFVIEEAPSLLNPQMMRGQNIFKDISRQGRKFNIGLCTISQQVTTLDPAIMSNLNTMIHLPIGSDYERSASVRNATSGVANSDLQSLDGTIGIAIISGIWLTNFQKIQIPRYRELFDRTIRDFQALSTGNPPISL